MKLLQIDAFTSEPFAGNPAAVCVLDDPRDDAWMAAVAREMNLSETAFLERRDGAWGLRWFTPAVEVELCGHATLASAHALWELQLAAPTDTLRFETRSGTLTAQRSDAGIVLDFPAEPATAVPWIRPLLDALDVDTPIAFARNRFDYLVELADAERVRSLRPDMALLAEVPTRGVIVTARGDTAAFDFVSRWFGPRVGVDEDPVTGSAHCCLGPWWSERLGLTELRGHQASPRGGSVGVRVLGERVELIGNAVTVLRGELVT
ncbi:MAG TPA: PhzF family phenazine biosynthesis protein [Longimicrobiales bacterium]